MTVELLTFEVIKHNLVTDQKIRVYEGRYIDCDLFIEGQPHRPKITYFIQREGLEI